MAGVAELIERLRGSSRRAVAGLLAGGGVLASRPAAELLATASELFDIGVGLFLLYQTLGGDDSLAGTVLTYVFFGYLVYAYTPELYPKPFGDIVEARGFRALTAVTTIYFGLIFGRATGLVPDAGPFGQLSGETADLLVALTVGVLAGILAFSGYIFLIRGERLLGSSGDHLKTFDSFAVQPLQEDFEKLQTLPQPRRRVVVAVNESAVGVIYVLPAALLGVGLPIVGLLSPIPEGLVAGAVLGSYVPFGGRLIRRFPDRTTSDLEFRIADDITDSLQNEKGLVLVLFCSVGLLGSGLALVAFTGVVVEAGGQFAALGAEIAANPGVVSELSLSELGFVAAALWGIVGVLTILMTYGLYGLLYWFRQLQRLPTYATFWEAYWRGESRSFPTASVTRPPGLFLPGNALILGGAGLVWLAPDGGSLRVWVVWGAVWPVLVGIVVWSVRAGSRRSPQPLGGEGRDVLVAFLLQLASTAVASVVWREPLGVEILLGVPLLLGGIAYLPEVSVYSERRQGAVNYLDWLYMPGLFAVTLFICEALTSVPRIVYLIVAGILLVWLLVKIIEHSAPSADE